MNTATEIYLYTSLFFNILGIVVRLGLLGYGPYPRTLTGTRGQDAIWIVIGIGFTIWVGFCFGWIGR